MEEVVGLPGSLVVEDRLAQLALDQLVRRAGPLWQGVTRLQVLPQVELDHVLLAAQVAVVDRARLPGDVHLDLLARPESGDRIDERRDSLVAGPDVVLDGLHSEELGGAVLALVQLAGPSLCPMVGSDVVGLANLQGILFTTEATEVLDVSVGVLLKLVLYSEGHSLKHLTADVAGYQVVRVWLRLWRAWLWPRLCPPHQLALHVNGPIGVKSEVCLELRLGWEEQLTHHTLVARQRLGLRHQRGLLDYFENLRGHCELLEPSKLM